MEIREKIISRQNPLVKKVCALSDKKGRREQGLFRFDGKKLFCEAIACGVRPVYVLVRCDGEEFPAFVREALERGLSPQAVIPVSGSVFEKLSEEKSPEGILTVARTGEMPCTCVGASGLAGLVRPEERLLLLQSLRDPGNLGTVIRSCAALGIDRLILSEDCADLFHPRTLRATMGAIFRLPVCVLPEGEFADGIRALRTCGRRVYAAALHRDSLTVGSFALNPGDCFVIGNEGHGLPQETVDACDASAVIPMRQGSESLNAAAAATVCIWETVRA